MQYPSSKMRVGFPRNYEQEIQTNRPFTSIINYTRQLSHTPKTRLSLLQWQDRLQNGQNFSPQMSIQEGRKIINGNQDNFTMISTNDQMNKKKDNRNRDFVMRVQNINKIHEQINEMLSLVKCGESRSPCRTKQLTKSYSVEKNIDSILKQRSNNFINDSSTKKDKLIGHKPQRKIQQAFRTTVEQNNQQLHLIRDNDIGKLSNIDIPYHKKSINEILFPIRKQMTSSVSKNIGIYPAIGKQQSTTSFKQDHLGYNKNYVYGEVERISSYGRRQNSKEEKNRREVQYRQGVHEGMGRDIKNNRYEEKGKKYQHRGGYEYNFSNRESDGSVGQNAKLLQTSKLAKKNNGQIDYCYEISKVKQRIEYSEQVTKKMQQRLLVSPSPHKKKHHHNHNTVSKSKKCVDGNYEHSVNKNMEHCKNKNPSYENQKDQYRKKGEKRNNKEFKIKVYPCTFQDASRLEISKQEVCSIIALKLSEQIMLDRKLREARQMFSKNALPNKWKLLKQKLLKLSYSYTEQQLQRQFALSQSQSNSLTVQSSSNLTQVQNLAVAFINSQQFWQKKMSAILSRSAFQRSGFHQDDLDIDRKGYILSEDLIKFIQMHTSNRFNAVDLEYLFRRLGSSGSYHGVEYENFINVIVCQ